MSEISAIFCQKHMSNSINLAPDLVTMHMSAESSTPLDENMLWKPCLAYVLRGDVALLCNKPDLVLHVRVPYIYRIRV